MGKTINKNATKFFIVADSGTGAILANVSLFVADGFMASMIINGVNNDVFVGGPVSLSRIYV